MKQKSLKTIKVAALIVTVIAIGSLLIFTNNGTNLFQANFDSSKLKIPPKSGPDVFYMQDDGTFLDQDGSTLQDIVAKKFYSTHQDTYDFLAIYTTFGNPALSDYFIQVKNDIKGLGQGFPLQDNSAIYGSSGTLKGVADIHNIDKYTNSSGDLLHELGHNWLAGTNNLNDDKSTWITQGDLHWSHFLDTSTHINGITYYSPNGGSIWKDNGNGTFTQDFSAVPIKNALKFTSIELYLMGFLPKEKVQPTFLVVTNEPLNQTVSGTKKIITIDDLIKIAGPREPSYPNSQTDFKVGFILVTPKGVQATQDQMNKINWISQNFPQEWNDATSGFSTINKKSAPVLKQFPPIKSIKPFSAGL